MATKEPSSRVPAPDKLGKGYAGDEESDEAAADATADEDKAARVSLMQEFMDAMGLTGDAEEACRTLDAYLDSR